MDRIPARIRQLKFGLSSNQDITNISEIEVTDRNVYDLTPAADNTRALTKNGPMDPHMGISAKNTVCETCGERLDLCSGHFGHIRLALPT